MGLLELQLLGLLEVRAAENSTFQPRLRQFVQWVIVRLLAISHPLLHGLEVALQVSDSTRHWLS